MTDDAQTASSMALAVRDRIVEALELDLIGPWPGHELADERLPGRTRPSNWYLTGLPRPARHPGRGERRHRRRGGARRGPDLGRAGRGERRGARRREEGVPSCRRWASARSSPGRRGRFGDRVVGRLRPRQPHLYEPRRRAGGDHRPLAARAARAGGRRAARRGRRSNTGFCRSPSLVGSSPRARANPFTTPAPTGGSRPGRGRSRCSSSTPATPSRRTPTAPMPSNRS